MKEVEYVSVNEGQDVWKIDHEVGYAYLVDGPLSDEIKIKELHDKYGFSCSVDEYLEELGYNVKENADWSMEFSKRNVQNANPTI